jgi:hypothetical protein
MTASPLQAEAYSSTIHTPISPPTPLPHDLSAPLSTLHDLAAVAQLAEENDRPFSSRNTPPPELAGIYSDQFTSVPDEALRSQIYLDHPIWPLTDDSEALLLRHYVQNLATWVYIIPSLPYLHSHAHIISILTPSNPSLISAIPTATSKSQSPHVLAPVLSSLTPSSPSPPATSVKSAATTPLPATVTIKNV